MGHLYVDSYLCRKDILITTDAKYCDGIRGTLQTLMPKQMVNQDVRGIPIQLSDLHV